MKKLLFQFLFSILLILVTLILIEIVFRLVVFREGSNYDRIYTSITVPNAKAPYSSQPYLNYINTPGLQDTKGVVRINSMGLRYPREVSLRKPDSTFRVLFLGGSTTFGDIEDSYDVFPALIEKALRDSISALDGRFKKVECLNGGVHGLTSAEILNHYQFKYQYLEADLIVLHTGFNDAFTYAQIHGSKYQPDYHNSRRVFQDITISPTERILLHSKALAYLIIQVRLRDFLKTTLEDNIFFHHTNDKPWFAQANSAISDSNYNAFYNNIKTLATVAESRNVPILLVPEVCDKNKMPPGLDTLLPNGLKLNHAFLKKIAIQKKLYFMALPDSEFTSDLFLPDDGIHVNEKGELLKARYIGNAVKDILRKRFEK